MNKGELGWSVFAFLLVGSVIVAALAGDFIWFLLTTDFGPGRSLLERYPSPDGAWVLEIGTTDCGAMDNFHFDGTLVERATGEETRLFFDPRATTDFEVRWVDNRNLEILASWPVDSVLQDRVVGTVRTRLVRRL